MDSSERRIAADEAERLRQALEAETRACLDVRKQLEKAGADFEEFVSRAAHDLREPLRDVTSYSQLLAETNGGSLDSDAGEYLQRIQEGAARMQTLLADVVDYWAAGAGERQFSRTDMEAIVRQAILSTEKQIAERGAIVTYDPLPPVVGEFDILAKVVRHLIGNAIEYCDAPSPRIHISSRQRDLDCLISVRDNGPGIEAAFQDRIFEPFKRLHGKEYPGNGLGLAFCKKAIERHGGRMWVESSPGKGSTFYFTLPGAE